MCSAIQVNTELISKARGIKERGRRATREERMQVLKELELEQEALKNGWSEEEKENNRAAVEQKIKETADIEKEEIRLEVEYLLNKGKDLSEFDRARAKSLVKKHPETAEIMEEIVNYSATSNRASCFNHYCVPNK